MIMKTTKWINFNALWLGCIKNETTKVCLDDTIGLYKNETTKICYDDTITKRWNLFILLNVETHSFYYYFELTELTVLNSKSTKNARILKLAIFFSRSILKDAVPLLTVLSSKSTKNAVILKSVILFSRSILKAAVPSLVRSPNCTTLPRKDVVHRHEWRTQTAFIDQQTDMLTWMEAFRF